MLVPEDIDRTLVAIFDIEGFSKRNPKQQADLVASFIERLDIALDSDLGQSEPDGFSTGDGAIISIGRRCKVDSDAVVSFLDFVVGFTADLLQEGLIIRTAVNYSEGDRILPLADAKHIRGEYIQIGDTINKATRVLSFCEPREIMVTDTVIDLLRRNDLEKRYAFEENKAFITKHEEPLKTHTYRPDATQRGYMYGPDAPEHPYKRYSVFPPIKAETFRFFRDNGLDFELRKVVGSAYTSMRHVNDTMTFTSWSNILDVLTSLSYDRADSVVVLSRNDHPSNFWTQKRGKIYLDYLRRHANESGGYINQTRIMVYDDTADEQIMDSDSKTLFDALRELHDTNSLFSFPASRLFKYDLVQGLRFGFTLSERHEYSIVAVPSPDDLNGNEVDAHRLGDWLARFHDYDQRDGPMKAIINGNRAEATALLGETKEMLKDPFIECLK
jgi:hypothetical protein